MNIQIFLILIAGTLNPQVRAPINSGDSELTIKNEKGQFQESASLNDERVKVFVELEAEAKKGDIEALSNLGDYYISGQFPVNKNFAKAEEYWTKGATLGSEECAHKMCEYFNQGTESESVIEKTKWALIRHQLYRLRNGIAADDFQRPKRVSESSFLEAKNRARAFLDKSKLNESIKTPMPETSTTYSAPLRFGSLTLFDEYRRKVCAEYMKAAVPIYNKGDLSSEPERKAFNVAALELVRLQAYVGKEQHPLHIVLSDKGNRALREINSQKIDDLYAKMSAAEIKTTAPATRAELNEASKYINALGNLLQLPVALYTY